MNWLAHVHLSPPDVEFQLGNLLADALRREPSGIVGAAFEQGRRCHAVIDRFTDTHEIVMRSKMRIRSSHRRYAGILVDIFYDHFLAKRWEAFHPHTLRAFTLQFHHEAACHLHRLPEEGADLVGYVLAADRLYSYLSPAGIATTLERMSLRLSSRWKRTVRLQDAMADLEERGPELEGDFLEFFPQLVTHLHSERWLHGNGVLGV